MPTLDNGDVAQKTNTQTNQTTKSLQRSVKKWVRGVPAMAKWVRDLALSVWWYGLILGPGHWLRL